MKFRVMYKGLEVVVDSFEDLDFLAEQAQRVQTVPDDKQKANVPVSQNYAEKRQGLSPNIDPMRSLVDRLPHNTLELLMIISSSGKAMTDVEIRKKLNLDNNMQIAGRVAPISRIAKKQGVSPEVVIFSRKIRNKRNGSRFEYRVANEAIPYITERYQRSGASLGFTDK